MKISGRTAFTLLVFPLFLACNEVSEKKVTTKDVIIADTETMKIDEPEMPAPPVDISAYLVYKDNTTSSFDILNNKSIVLWNTIIGEGDTKKPSDKTKIVLKGRSAGFRFVVYNGKQKVVDRNLAYVRDSTVFFIANTGCQEIKVQLSRSGKLIYENHIPFRCGE